MGYKAAARMKEGDIYRGSRPAFDEMALNGIITVCDFFYVIGHGCLARRLLEFHGHLVHPVGRPEFSGSR